MAKLTPVEEKSHLFENDFIALSNNWINALLGLIT